jgi:hypothetical protein
VTPGASRDECAAGHVATLPIDPFTGQPPVYAREGAGFTCTRRGEGRPYRDDVGARLDRAEVGRPPLRIGRAGP